MFNMFQKAALAIFVGALSTHAIADDVTLTFDDLRVGSTLSDQYQSLGVTFRASPLSGSGTSSSGADWAKYTDLTIESVSSLGPGMELSGPPLVSGHFVRPYDGFLREDGDANFDATFAMPVTKFSMDFAGLSSEANAAMDTRIFAYSGTELLGEVRADPTTTSGQFTLRFEAPAISRVVIAPGSFNAWVAVDNMTFSTPVPEPRTGMLLLAGLGAILAMGSRRQRSDQQLG